MCLQLPEGDASFITGDIIDARHTDGKFYRGVVTAVRGKKVVAVFPDFPDKDGSFSPSEYALSDVRVAKDWVGTFQPARRASLSVGALRALHDSDEGEGEGDKQGSDEQAGSGKEGTSRKSREGKAGSGDEGRAKKAKTNGANSTPSARSKRR